MDSVRNIDANDIHCAYGGEELSRQINRVLVDSIKVINFSEDKYKEVIISDSLQEIFSNIIKNIEEVNFLDYIKQAGGDITKYLGKGGVARISHKIISVIVVEYGLLVIDKLGYRLCQLNNNDSDTEIGYLYNKKYWQEVNNKFIKNLLRDILIKMGYDRFESKTSYLMDILLKTFWSNADNTPLRDKNKVLINLSDCTLEIAPNGEIKKSVFRADNFITYSLPYNYDTNQTCPNFIKYLNRVLPDKESQFVLQELIGNAFVKNINLEKIGILYGSGSNGKSVFLKIITALFGEHNLSQMDLKSLTTDKNADNNRFHLMNKLLNFAPEINAKGDQAHDLIKRMASGEAIQVKILYKNTITIDNYAKLIFNANTLPADVEHTHGFFRRFIIVAFDQTISEEESDPELARKIISNELPGVLNWVIEGTKRIIENQKFSQCRKSDEIMVKYKLESDVVAMWVNEYEYISHEYESVLLKELYLELKKFADEGGYKCPTIKTVANRLRNLGFKTEKPKGYPTLVYLIKNK